MKRSTASSRTRRFCTPSADRLTAAASAVLLAATVLSLLCGAYPLDGLFSGDGREMALRVFFGLRLPRVAAGVLAGAVLGVTGAVCQTVFASPLASPDVTGVASGASLGAAAAILLGVGGIARIGCAFLGGLVALGLLLGLVRLSRSAGAEISGRYLLAGILVSAAADAGVMILKTAADPERELAAIEFWTMGSFAALTADKLALTVLASLPPLLLLCLFSRQALILSRGSEEARAVGVSPALWQAILLVLVTWAVAGVVSVVGVIGFVGLIVPHMALAIGGRRGRGFLPLCGLLGAILTVVSDLLARMLVPGAELPVTVFGVGFAVIWFLLLFCRGRVTGGGGEC